MESLTILRRKICSEKILITPKHKENSHQFLYNTGVSNKYRGTMTVTYRQMIMIKGIVDTSSIAIVLSPISVNRMKNYI